MPEQFIENTEERLATEVSFWRTNYENLRSRLRSVLHDHGTHASPEWADRDLVQAFEVLLSRSKRKPHYAPTSSPLGDLDELPNAAEEAIAPDEGVSSQNIKEHAEERAEKVADNPNVWSLVIFVTFFAVVFGMIFGHAYGWF